MPQEMPFGEWLKQRRTALDLTQWELAERIGCSRDTIQKIEAGRRRPSKQVAELLAACLGIAPAERAAFVSSARLGPGSVLPTLPPLPAIVAAQSSTNRLETLPPSHLPTPLTSLIGREQEIEAVRHYLSRSDVRLLSLVGPPGVGKTRLAIAAAASVTEAFEDGVHFVPLETISDPNLVASAIADSLEVKPVTDGSMLKALVAHLRDQHILLVLDNFEQVLDAGQQVLELLSGCPRLKVIVTSREALHVYGEWRFAVAPLKLPDIHKLSDLSLDALGGIASMALFTQRAQAVKADFVLAQDNAPVVAAICTRLDGLPLAIELAATRVSLLSLDRILSGLGSRLKLLSGDLRYLPHRQRTLRGAIDWSYHLLQPAERALFRRIGVFVGGFTPAAVEAVCNIPDPLAKDSEVPAGFQARERCHSLLDKSLVQLQIAERAKLVSPPIPSGTSLSVWNAPNRSDSMESRSQLLFGSAEAALVKFKPGEGLGADAEGRYTMLEGLREYAVEQLQLSGEEQLLRRRHAEHFLALVQDAAAQLDGPEQYKWLHVLEAENDNIRAALTWSVNGGPETAEMALRLSGGLGKFWDIHGHASEGRRWLELALANASEPARARDDSTTGRSAAASIPALVRIKAVTAAGNLAIAQSDFVAARAFHEQALALSQEANHKIGIATSFLNLGNIANHLGEYAQSRSFHAQALSLFRELADKPRIARTLLNMGFGAKSRGDSASARAFYEEALALRRELGDQYGIALALGNLADVAMDQGDYDRARALLEESRSIRQEIGDERGIAYCLAELANIARAERDYAQAFSLCKASLVLRRKVGDTEGVAACLEWLADAYADLGQVEQGVRLWGAAQALRRAIRAPIPLAHRSRYEQAVARVRAEWDEEAFARAWAEGCKMTLDQSIAYVLNEAK